MLLDSDLRSQQRVMPSHRALIPWPLARAERRVRAQSAARRGHGARYSPAHLPRAARVMCAAGMLGRAGTHPSGDSSAACCPRGGALADVRACSICDTLRVCCVADLTSL